MDSISDMRMSLPTPPNSPMFPQHNNNVVAGRSATLSASSLLDFSSPLLSMGHHVQSNITGSGGDATPRWEVFAGPEGTELWDGRSNAQSSGDLEVLSPLALYHHSCASPGINMYAQSKATPSAISTTTFKGDDASSTDMVELEPMSRESSPSPKRRPQPPMAAMILTETSYPSMLNISLGTTTNVMMMPPNNNNNEEQTSSSSASGRRRRAASKVTSNATALLGDDDDDDDEGGAGDDHDDDMQHTRAAHVKETTKHRNKKKRIVNGGQPALKRAVPSGASGCPPIPMDEEDHEIVRRANAEDAEEYKQTAFPGLLEACRPRIEAARGDQAMIVDALLDAFTMGNKHGRPIPKACMELIRGAAELVQESRKLSKKEGTGRGKFKASLMERDGDHFPCPQCDKVYTTLEGLRLHDRNHHQVDKQWSCNAEGCKEHAFVRAADLRMHVVRMHSPIRPFPCRIPGCVKQYAAHSELRRHIQVQHGDIVDVLAGRVVLPLGTVPSATSSVVLGQQ